MACHLARVRRWTRFARLGMAVIVGACLTLAGCQSMHQGDVLLPDENSTLWGRSMHEPGGATGAFGVSNEARRIEGDVGVR